VGADSAGFDVFGGWTVLAIHEDEYLVLMPAAGC
jgi:hypothetical protein